MAITNHANVTVTNPMFDEELSPKGRIVKLTEGASQSFKKGEFVALSSGKVVIASTLIAGPATIFGIAMADASGTTDADCYVRLVECGDYLIMSLANLSAVDTGSYAQPAVANVGVIYGVTKETADNNKWVLNVHANTSNKTFEVVALVPFREQDKFTAGSSNAYGARVVVRPVVKKLTSEA